MYLCISILSRLTLKKGVIVFCVARTFTVIAGRGFILRVQGYRLIVPAFRGIMARPLTDLTKIVSVEVVGSILVVFPFVFSACHHCVPWTTTKHTASLLSKLCCLVLLGAVWI